MPRESREVEVLRNMAWERAKGELLSILHTIYSDYDDDDRFEKLAEFFNKFIREFEDNWL